MPSAVIFRLAFSSDYKLVQVIIYINTFTFIFLDLCFLYHFHHFFHMISQTSAAASSSLVLLPNGVKKSFLSLNGCLTQAESLAQALQRAHSIHNVCKSSFN